MSFPDEPSVSSRRPSRRTLLGAAWAAPVLIAATATPAYAASPDAPVLDLVITAIDTNGYTVVLRIEHANFQVWPSANFEFQLLDEEFQEWLPVAHPTTDGSGDWMTVVAYQDIEPNFLQARVLFNTGGIDYVSAAVRLPPPPPTVTTSVQHDVQGTYDIFTQITPRLTGTSATPYESQGQDSGGTWNHIVNGTTDSSGAAIVNVPDLDGVVAVRTHVVVNTYDFYSPSAPVPA